MNDGSSIVQSVPSLLLVQPSASSQLQDSAPRILGVASRLHFRWRSPYFFVVGTLLPLRWALSEPITLFPRTMLLMTPLMCVLKPLLHPASRLLCVPCCWYSGCCFRGWGWGGCAQLYLHVSPLCMGCMNSIHTCCRLGIPRMRTCSCHCCSCGVFVLFIILGLHACVFVHACPFSVLNSVGDRQLQLHSILSLIVKDNLVPINW